MKDPVPMDILNASDDLRKQAEHALLSQIGMGLCTAAQPPVQIASGAIFQNAHCCLDTTICGDLQPRRVLQHNVGVPQLLQDVCLPHRQPHVSILKALQADDLRHNMRCAVANLAG